MAGRPRKTSMFDDIKEIETTEEKPIKKTKVEKTEIAPEPSYRTGVVKTDSWLNVRGGPAVSFPIVGRLENEDKVTIYETNKNFGKISITEDKWVNLDFII